MNITCYYGSGSDSGFAVYLDGECQADFDDIRFTEDDGETLLDYWLEDKTDSNYARFWVEISDDLGSDVTIYVYYGNESASSLSDGDATFLSFTHFDGDDLDDDWTVIDEDMGSHGVASSLLTLQSDATSHSVWFHRVLGINTTFTVPFRLRADIDGYSQSSSARKIILFGIGDCYDSGSSYHSERHQLGGNWDGASVLHQTRNNGDYEHTVLTPSPSAGTWELTTASNVSDYIENDVLRDGNDYSPTGSQYVVVGVASGFGSGTYSYIVVDWLFISKFLSPEPSHAEWGSVEGAVSYITFRFYVGGLFRVDNATMTNGTVTAYANATILELASLPQNESWVFVRFDWGTGNATSNPHNFTVPYVTNTTIWLIYRDPPLKAKTAIQFVGLAVIGGIIAFCLLIAFWRRRQD